MAGAVLGEFVATICAAEDKRKVLQGEKMAEKGGKGYVPATGGKSSLKSPVGNGDSSGKSKGKGKKVQFDSEDSLEDSIPTSNGRADTPASKGGKGDKVANGSKKSTKKATSSVERKIDQELPQKSLCLMDCEAAEILQGIQEQMVILSQDPDIKLPVSFDMGLTYAKRSGNQAKPETVKRIFEPLKKHGVSETQICLIVNICPESVDEVFALIPALELSLIHLDLEPKMSKLKDPLRIALGELANLKEALASLKRSRCLVKGDMGAKQSKYGEFVQQDSLGHGSRPSSSPQRSSLAETSFVSESTRAIFSRYRKIDDNYGTLDQVTLALSQSGLESSNLIVGIDFTKSNEWTGRESFNGRSLHHIGEGLNPYEHAISIIGRTLARFDEDNLIPCFGFGDVTTHDQDVFSFYPDHRPCNGFEEALYRYRDIAPDVRLAGPTSFAPIIDTAIGIVDQSGGQYHVLLIIADGQVTRSVDTEVGRLSPQEQKTVEAIVRASEYPLSIVVVGVGDGPWDVMREFDDNIPARVFDNIQFVNFTEIMSRNVGLPQKEAEFALAALMEIPLQYRATLELHLLGDFANNYSPMFLRSAPFVSGTSEILHLDVVIRLAMTVEVISRGAPFAG
ncbi:E3 ubiquitin-protein ligase rglg2 [Phtheirospermum japonicum]|uniref:E3 ubiquitin-protein ligase rglg2 n=1 Tax=Phtheirospermum japonicum TaxID=374723 RepID=A0A830C6X0_9LAMI|nr:E3 ubiquitin-protein ligase rglg2 [Phtheirospermum japonicum]